MQLAEFLSQHATALTTRILTQFTPRYTPTTTAREQLTIPGWKRPLFAAQLDAVAAAMCGLRTMSTLGLAAEPGFGKTCTTLAIACALGCRRP